MRNIFRTSCALLKIVRENNIQNRFIFASLVPARPCLQIEWEAPKETIFNRVICSQQKRDYAPKTLNSQIQCWNCKKELVNKTLVKCQKCGFLQDVQADINYFELLDFPQKFDLETQTLTKRFRQLQTEVHPDKFSTKSSREQSNSADWSSLINKAYKTLSVPLERGQYLLELKGLRMPEDNSALHKEFLMDMMERNEEVERAATRDELNAINENLTQELKKKVHLLATKFSENNLEMAKTLLIEMKYLLSIQKTTKNKLQSLLEN